MTDEIENEEIDFFEKPKREKKEYTKEGVRIVECQQCKKYEFMSRIGRIKNYVYCMECYMKKTDEKINEWKWSYRRYRNGKENFGAIEIGPRLSSYIN